MGDGEEKRADTCGDESRSAGSGSPCPSQRTVRLSVWMATQTKTRTVLPGSCYFGYWPRLPNIPITLTHAVFMRNK